MMFRQSKAVVQQTGDVHPGKPSRSASAQRRVSNPKMGNQAAQRRLRDGVIQAKLTVNQPGDRFEQEADRVADEVMRMSEPQSMERTVISGSASSAHIQRVCREGEEGVSSQPVAIQRMCDNCEEELKRQPTLQAKRTTGAPPEVTPEIASRIQSLQGDGQALPASVRNFFEPRFGQDFSHVRVRTDVASTQSLRARAYTVGRNIVFGAGRYSPETSEGKRLLAHELTHVVQQGGAVPRPIQSKRGEPSTTFQRTSKQASSQASDVIQRAGDPAAIPLGFPCPHDLTPGRPAGPDLLFPSEKSDITTVHTALLTTFRATWLAAGGTDDILVHGYASTDGAQGLNWTLSCNRAQAVQAELIRLGIPAVRINIVAHGESTDFGPSAAANRHAVVSTSPAGFISLPIITGILTARDNFAGRSAVSFGVDETIDLSFFSFPPRPAADFGGLQWFLVSGGGTLTPGLVPNDGTATYRAPAAAGAVQLELRVAAGATAGRVISTHAITIVTPNGVRMTEIPGTSPGFANPGVVPVGTWGAGFQANIFIDPRDVSFRGIMFGEGTVLSVVTPAGSFLTPFAGLPHPVGGLNPGQGGNVTTGTPLAPAFDNITTGQLAPTGAILGLPTCGASDFLWAIPWEFSVAGGPRTPFAPANHHATSTLFCNATIEKAGAGPFCRRINGTTC